MKIIVNLFPYFARNNPVFYSWLGPVAAKSLGSGNVIVIGSQVQMAPPSEQEHGGWINGLVKECSDTDWASVEKIIVPDNVLGAKEYDQSGDGAAYFKTATTSVYLEYKNYLEKELRSRITEGEPVIALQTVNDQSFKNACNSLGITVYHSEAGPIRRPNFNFGTYFFDEQGVNGKSSFLLLCEKVRSEWPRFPIHTRESICEALYGRQIEWCGEYEVGICHQVEDDSNIICYSGGYDKLALHYKALWVFPSSKILVRDHPLARFKYASNELGISEDAIGMGDVRTFIHRCKRLITINSSVAFEFALHGRELYALGEGPYRTMGSPIINRDLIYNGPPKDKLDFIINVMMFLYLIPESLFLNLDYLKFRSKNPSLNDIYRKHVEEYSSINSDLYAVVR